MTLCEAAWKGTSADFCGVHWGGSGQRGRYITAAESSLLERVSSGPLETSLLKTHYCYLLASCYSNRIGESLPVKGLWARRALLRLG